MKMTVDIPDQILADAMHFTGAKTEPEAVAKAIAEFNRRKRVDDFMKLEGTFSDFPTNDEIEAADIADAERMMREFNKK